MNKLGEKALSLILKSSLPIIVITLLLSLAALIFIPRIRFDNSVEAFFDKKSKSFIDFQKWKKEFGDDQVIIAAFSDEDIFTEANLKLIARLTERFESVKYAHDVRSLTTVNDIIGSESDFIVRRLIENIPSERAALQELKKRALENPLYLKNVISEDGKTASLIIELEHRPGEDDIYKKEVMENALKIMEENFPKDKKYYISGPTAFEFFYTSYMRKDLKTFLPIAFLLITIVLLLSFRTFSGFILPFAAISISLLLTMFLQYLMGFSINNITTIIPPIMVATSVEYSIHLVGDVAKGRALEESMKKLFLPCLLTALTTVAGFLALAVNKIPPIRETGLVVGFGTIFAFVITFTFIPACIKQFGLFKEKPELYGRNKNKTGFPGPLFDNFIIRIARFSEKFCIWILGAATLLVGLSLWGSKRIVVDTNIMDYFKKDSFIHKSTSYIDENLSGTNFLEISLKAKDRDYFKEPEILTKIDKFEEFLSEIPAADKSASLVQYIKEMNKSFHNEDEAYYVIPDSRKLISQYLLLYGANDLEDYVDSEWKWATVRLRLSEHNGAAIKKILNRIENYMDKNFPEEIEKELLGWPVLDVETNSNITTGQIQSLGIAMLTIFGMMFILFGSLNLGFISVAPNALPILINFGVMGAMAIRLDAATSMISAIIIGIIVDDTTHFIWTFKEEIKKDKNYTLAIEKTLLDKGIPITLSTLVIFFGFGIFVFSNFMPTIYFGVLSASIMFTAFFAEIIMDPALLFFFKPKVR